MKPPVDATTWDARNRALRACSVIVALVGPPALAEDAATIRELLCGRTLHFFDAEIGNQIEYTASDGTAYLLHNDIDGVGLGTWRVTEDSAPEGAQVCYTYQPGTFGPEDAGSQFCFGYNDLVVDLQPNGVRDGDPYRLTEGKRPFLLPIDRPASVASLRAQYADQPPERACGMPMM